MRCLLPPAKGDRTHYEDQYQQPGNQLLLLRYSVKIDSIATKPLDLYISMGANLTRYLIIVTVQPEKVSHPTTKGSRYSLSCCGIREISFLNKSK